MKGRVYNSTMRLVQAWKGERMREDGTAKKGKEE